MTRVTRWALMGTMWLLASAGVLQAQTISGTVRDVSGAVMPGVTVEASSSALIEKARSVVTDGTGQYSIVNLSPGTYTVTFALTGFSSVRREGIQLSINAIATALRNSG